MSNVTKDFSVFDLPKKCYEIVKRNWKLYALVNVLALLSAFFALFDNQYSQENINESQDFSNTFSNASTPEIAAIIGAGAVFVLVYALISFVLYIFTLSLTLRSSETETPTGQVVINDFKKYWLRLLVLHIVLAVIVVVGLILLILPGLAAIFFLSFAPYFMIDKNLGVQDSIKQSYEFVKNHSSSVAGLFLLSIGLLFVLGILSAIPFLGSFASTILAIILSPLYALYYVKKRKSVVAKA